MRPGFIFRHRRARPSTQATIHPSILGPLSPKTLSRLTRHQRDFIGEHRYGTLIGFSLEDGDGYAAAAAADDDDDVTYRGDRGRVDEARF